MSGQDGEASDGGRADGVAVSAPTGDADPEIPTRDGDAKAQSPPRVHVDDADILVLVEQLLRTLNRSGQHKKEIARGAGLDLPRVNAMINQKSQRTKLLPVAEIGAVLGHAERFAAGTADRTVQRVISGSVDSIRGAIYARLGDPPRAPSRAIEFAHLKLDSAAQDAFNERHAGIYALLRFARDGQMVVTRTTIHAKAKEDKLSRFTTDRVGRYGIEALVEGYMYVAQGLIYSIGISEEGLFRSGILQPAAEAGQDLLGLRLHMSVYDDGPFSHRVYFRRIADLGGDESKVQAWAPFCKGRLAYSSDLKARLALLVPDIDDICDLLRPDQRGLGLGMPD